MQEIIQQKQILESRRFRNSLILNLHSCIFPAFGAGLMTLFYGQNNTLSLFGCLILLYLLTIGVNLIIPYCSNANYDIEKELQQLSKTFEDIKAINQSLDDRRDTMLFDDDPSYWQILEELDVPK